MKSYSNLLLLFLLFPVVAISSEQTVKTTKLQLSNQTLTLEIANTPKLKQLGLSHRKKLSKNAGMIFLYPKGTHDAFWMKNTTIPLSIAFLDRDKCIMEILTMNPPVKNTPVQQLKLYRPKHIYYYALELNQGWLKAHQVTVGDCLSRV